MGSDLSSFMLALLNINLLITLIFIESYFDILQEKNISCG